MSEPKGTYSNGWLFQLVVAEAESLWPGAGAALTNLAEHVDAQKLISTVLKAAAIFQTDRAAGKNFLQILADEVAGLVSLDPATGTVTPLPVA